MELISIILAAFSSWLLLHYLATDSLRQARKRAGGLLLSLENRANWKSGALWIGGVGMLVIFCLESTDRSGELTLGQGLFIYSALFLLLLVMAPRRLSPLELRERGLVRRFGGPDKLIPWKDVSSCEWGAQLGTLHVRFARTYMDVCISPKQLRQATVILLRYVEVRDPSGIIPRDEADATASAAEDFAEVPPAAKYQFSLPALLLLMLLASSIFSWAGIRYRRNKPRQDAIARVERFLPNAFLFRFWGELDFSNCPIKPTDEDMECLEYIQDLYRVDISNCPITDQGARHLASVRNLNSLKASHTNITDAGLADLATFPHLYRLELDGCRITDAGLRHLEGMKSLDILRLRGTGVSKEGIKKLCRTIPGLEVAAADGSFIRSPTKKTTE